MAGVEGANAKYGNASLEFVARAFVSATFAFGSGFACSAATYQRTSQCPNFNFLGEYFWC